MVRAVISSWPYWTMSSCERKSNRNYWSAEKENEKVLVVSFMSADVGRLSGASRSAGSVITKCVSGNTTHKSTLIARFMGPTRGPSGADRTQVGPMLAPWTLLSGATTYRGPMIAAMCLNGTPDNITPTKYGIISLFKRWRLYFFVNLVKEYSLALFQYHPFENRDAFMNLCPRLCVRNVNRYSIENCML